MRRSIRSLAVPALAGVVREKSTALAAAAVKNSVYAGADMIDLHLSTLEDISREALERIIAASNVPVLALNYNSKLDWSYAGFDEDGDMTLGGWNIAVDAKNLQVLRVWSDE